MSQATSLLEGNYSRKCAKAVLMSDGVINFGILIEL